MTGYILRNLGLNVPSNAQAQYSNQYIDWLTWAERQINERLAWNGIIESSTLQLIRDQVECIFAALGHPIRLKCDSRLFTVYLIGRIENAEPRFSENIITKIETATGGKINVLACRNGHIWIKVVFGKSDSWTPS